MSCYECDHPAVWAWGTIQLCDDHAASKDLDDLEEL